EYLERPHSLPRCRKIRRHGFPASSDKSRVQKKFRLANLVWIAERALGAGMSLVQDAMLAPDHFDDVRRRSYVIHRTVLRMLPLQRTVRRLFHEPVNRLGKGYGPVAAQYRVPLLGRNQ